MWLALGLFVPLVAAGFYNLSEFWRLSRNQLDESVVRQAELAATAFAQRVAAQQQTLETVGELAKSENRQVVEQYLNSIVETRPTWLDIQIIGANGEVVLAQSKKNLNLRAISVDALRQEAAREKSLVIVTEQSEDEKLRLLSLALPTAGGGIVIARIDGASASSIFEQLDLPRQNIIAVFDSNNRLIYRSRVSPEQMSLDVGNTPLITALSQKKRGTLEIESPYDGIRRVYGLTRIDAINVAVVVGIPSDTLYAAAQRRFLIQALLSLVIAALAVAAAFLIARSIIRPLNSLETAAERFGAGDLTVRADLETDQATSALGTAFNQMAASITEREEKLKELDRLKSEFVASVSHELRTPLTTIKTLTRVLQSGKYAPDEQAEFLETISIECDRQIEFVQTLLDLSRIESGAYKIERRPVDVNKLLSEITDDFRGAAKARNLSLKLNPSQETLPDPVTDHKVLRRIIGSLVENAMKYTPEGGNIEISSQYHNERIMISVKDSGCGISAEDLPRIFDRFYRGKPLTSSAENDEVNETPGIGLGLFLVASLIKEINAEINVISPVANQKRGTDFSILLPV